MTAAAVAALESENLRLRSIIHRAWAAVLSYQTREAIAILGEVDNPVQPSDAERERFATALWMAISDDDETVKR